MAWIHGFVCPCVSAAESIFFLKNQPVLFTHFVFIVCEKMNLAQYRQPLSQVTTVNYVLCITVCLLLTMIKVIDQCMEGMAYILKIKWNNISRCDIAWVCSCWRPCKHQGETPWGSLLGRHALNGEDEKGGERYLTAKEQ